MDRVNDNRTKFRVSEEGELIQVMNERGEEIPDPNPVALPISIKTREFDMFERMKMELAQELGIAHRPRFDDHDPEDDFDEDDPDSLLTRHEAADLVESRAQDAKRKFFKEKKDKKKDFKEGLSSMHAGEPGGEPLVQKDGGASAKPSKPEEA